MTLDDYAHWLRLARSYARVTDDAEDLLQACLLIALEQERLDFSQEQNRRWFTGVLKNRAAMQARSAVRRRTRAARHVDEMVPEQVDVPNPSDQHATTEVHWQLVRTFSPALRKVVALILLGLNRKEICTVLDLTSETLRQRLTAIRKTLRKLPDDLQREALALAYQRRTKRDDDLAIGLIRRALQRSVQRPASLGLHDPDGHLVIFSSR